MRSPIAFLRVLMVLAPMRLRLSFSFEKALSIGFKSWLQGRRNSMLATAA